MTAGAAWANIRQAFDGSSQASAYADVGHICLHVVATGQDSRQAESLAPAAGEASNSCLLLHNDGQLCHWKTARPRWTWVPPCIVVAGVTCPPA
jgi:hypothetical protein